MSREISLSALYGTVITENGRFTAEVIRLFQEITRNRRINTGTAQPFTIASGIVTIGTNYSYFSIDTQSAAASDDLDTISGGNEGDLIFIKAGSAARTVVLKDGTGNIITEGGVDLSIDSDEDLAMLHFNGTKWVAKLINVSA